MIQIVRANLVIGSDGSTTINGRSAGLSSLADRNRFHEMRQGFDAILIGGETARREPYQKTPIPLVVISRSLNLPESISLNPSHHLWNIPPKAAIERSLSEFGNALLIEGGAKFLSASLPWVTEIAITRSQVAGGENRIDLDRLIKDFSLTSEEIVESEKFQLFKRAN